MLSKLCLVSLMFIFLISPNLSYGVENNENFTTTGEINLERPIPFISGDINKAKHIASIENKSIILIFKTDWDKYSLKLDKILKDRKVINFLSDYVVVLLNDKRDVKSFEKYNIRSFPETMMVDQDGKSQGSFRGVINVKNYIISLKKLTSK